MKATSKNLSIAAVAIFMLGIVVISYYLYQAPAEIAAALGIQEMTQHNQISKVFMRINLIIGLEIGVGLLAIILLLTRNNSQNLSIRTIQDDNLRNQTTNQLSGEQNQQEAVLSEQLSKIESKLQGYHSDSKVMLEKTLTGICNELEASQGALFLIKQEDQKRILELTASYAYFFGESKTVIYEVGEGLVGQVAKEGKLLNISTVPEGYVTIISGLGSSSPNHLIIVPLQYEDVVRGVIEIASFKKFTKNDEAYLNGLSSILGKQLASQSQTLVDVQ